MESTVSVDSADTCKSKRRRLNDRRASFSRRARNKRQTRNPKGALQQPTSPAVEKTDFGDCSSSVEKGITDDNTSSVGSHLQPIVDEVAGEDGCGMSDVSVNSETIRQDLHKLDLECDHQESLYIVRGSFHQGNPRFPGSSRGKQCTANAAAALAMCRIRNPRLWSSEDVDSVLMAGENLYVKSMRTRHQVHPAENHAEYLAAEELSTEFEVRSQNCNLLREGVTFGHLDIDATEDGLPNLRRGLDQFFAADKYGIFTCNLISVAVFRNQNRLWMFDSHSRDSAGVVTPNGRACLMGFPDVESLYSLLRKNIPTGRMGDPFSDNYDLTEVQIQLEYSQNVQSAVSRPESALTDDCVEECDGLDEMQPRENDSSFLEDSVREDSDVELEECDGLDEMQPRENDSSFSEDSVREDSDVEREFLKLAEEERLVEEHELEVSSRGATDSFEDIATLQGRGIYAFQHVWKTLHEIFDEHSKGIECYFKNIKLVGYQRIGLKTQLLFKCSMCSFSKSVMSEPENDNVLDVNQSAALGSVSAGIGHSQLEEILGAMDVKCMAASTFRRYHDTVYDGLSKTATAEMEMAGKQERELALQRGDVINGIPHIPVIADGSWMKRSYKLGKYDSSSGLGAIVGFHTKKVLFVGIRNKFCSICDPASKKGAVPREHACYKNWGRNDSSTSMEADAILEGFKSSVDQHGLMYSTLIADGDSSVYKKITDYHPYREYDVYVKKVECGNHLRRNVGTKVKEIAKRKGIPGPIRTVINNSVPRFTAAFTKAVKYRLQQAHLSTTEKNKQLKRDILNAPSHIFGEHANCASLGYFCDGVPKGNEINYVPEMKNLGVFDALGDTVSRLSHHTESLLYNVSNNAVESFNGVVCKFIGAKRINYGKKNSYNARSLGAAVQFNSHKVLTRYREVTAKEPSQVASRMEANRERWLGLQKQRLAHAKQNRIATRAEPRPQTVDKDYGPSSQQPDLSPEAYAMELDRHMERLRELQRNRIAIERKTIGQSQSISMLWMSTRRKLLTASKFGKVCLMRKDTSCQSTVRSILYEKTLRNSPAIDWGRKHEPIARSELERIMSVRIQECGLFVDPEILGLGASPDGLIGIDGVVEIKCPHSARDLTPDEALDPKNGSVRRIFQNVDGNAMNPNHEYYFQVQGQLHITGREYCLFMVWMPNGSIIVRVTRDDEFWDQKMKPRLVQFYENCLVPEIVDSRYIRSMNVRDPSYILEARELTAKKKAGERSKSSSYGNMEGSEEV